MMMDKVNDDDTPHLYPTNTTTPASLGYLREAPWVLPLLAASATNAAAIVAYEVYVIVRAIHGTPSRRHLFLGQSLMMGLLLASLAGVPVALSPTPLTCAATRLLTGVSGALVFGALLVKCVFLISINSGVYLPAHYQALLLFFIVLVQITINLQWQWSQPAGVMVVRDAGVAAGGAGLLHLSCAASYRQLLLSLIYVILLLVVVAAMAVKCRSIRENYREAAYIGAALCLVLPLWLAWCLAGLVLPSSLQPACLGFGVVATATIVFVVMFVPKGRQLAAMGKEGVYEEDQEDHLSTISGGARYSPSFFHFKPVKTPKDFLQPTSVYKTRLHAPTIPECLLPSLPPPSHSPLPLLLSPTTPHLPHLHHHHHHRLPPPPVYMYWAPPPPPPPPLPPLLPLPPPHHYYYQHQWYAGADRGCGGVAEEGVYSTIDTPAQHSQQYTPASTNPNFYLFRSHAHAGMMY